MKIGAQLYTVREFTQNAEDFAATIKKVAEIGYKYVQISAIGSIPTQEVADICNANGVGIVITHTNQARVKDETDAVIAEHRIMGANYIGIGSMPTEYRSHEGIKRFIADYSPAAEKIRAAGMTFMYHNHAFEYAKYDGKLMMDYLAEGLTNMGFTLDTYWVQVGGADPAAWLKKLAGRVNVVHLKDVIWADDKHLMGEVMEGNLNWESIFAACREAGVQYAMVEQDNCYGADPFQCLKTSFDNLKGALKKWYV